MLRNILGIIFFLFCAFSVTYLFVIKKGRVKLIVKLLCTIGIVAVFFGTIIFPIDNYLFGFSSPQNVAKYAGSGNLILTLNNNEIGVCFLENSIEPNTFSTIITRKNGDKWQLSSPIINSSDKATVLSNYFVSSYYSNGTDNVVLTITTFENGLLESAPVIYDNKNSKFTFIQDMLFPGTHMYYTILDNADENYELSINGDTSKIFA